MKNKSVISKKSLVFLEKYLNNASPTGYEWEGQKIWMNYLKPYVDEFITDTYGTAVGVINPKAKFKVVIEGHSDEISWYVNYITDNGLIYVIRNGGSDHQIAPSKWVDIHTKNGIIKGVFGWPAIHTRTPGKEEQPKLDTIFIDIGAKNKKEVFIDDESRIKDENDWEDMESESEYAGLSINDIVEAMQSLSPAYQTVFNLYVMEGYTHQEIADELEINIGTSKSNLAKAKANMKTMLTEKLNRL